MPGLGPSLLPEFLADGARWTQPGRRQTEGNAMVESVRMGASTPRPAVAGASPSVRVVSSGNYEEFRLRLRPSSVASHAHPTSGAAVGPMAEPIRHSRPTSHSRNEGSESLAPEAEAGGGGQPDPAAWLALFNPGGGGSEAATALPAATAQAAPAATSPVEVADLVERWVRRVALGGDSRRGVARLDIGSGRLSGTEVVVMAEAGRVSVELSLPAGLNATELQERLQARLERRGFETDVVVR